MKHSRLLRFVCTIMCLTLLMTTVALPVAQAATAPNNASWGVVVQWKLFQAGKLTFKNTSNGPVKITISSIKNCSLNTTSKTIQPGYSYTFKVSVQAGKAGSFTVKATNTYGGSISYSWDSNSAVTMIVKYF